MRHSTWLFTAALLSFGLEGFMGTIGESIASGIGVNRSLMAVVGGTLMTWLYSWLYDATDEPPRRAPKSRKRSKK